MNVLLSTATATIEALLIKIKPGNSAKLLVGSLYRSPGSDESLFIGSLDIILSSLSHDGLEHILLGDFNFDENAR